ncbi:ESPR domain-containing protein, partial [Variovorax soli]
MNHIYRVVWRSALGTCVAVSETARGRGKSGRAAAPVRRGVPAL